MDTKGDIGVIGLAVMGQNLILNMNDKGYKVIAYNRTTEKVTAFLNDAAKDTAIEGAYSLTEFIEKISSPRKIMLMVKAGEVVDIFIDKLTPLLDKGDIIIDGGNSNYKDTERRTAALEKKGIYYIGAGISGGEEGARRGPSIMPGGSFSAWQYVEPIFRDIAAKTEKGEVCCDWIGGGGAGHFVKMVHNGIEYGDMQLICEAYHFMKDILQMNCDEMAQLFRKWNETELASYLTEITADILEYKEKDGTALITKILDTAGQKGTGKWTAINALQYGIPLTLITEAVFSRALSSLKEERVEAASLFDKPVISERDKREKEELITALFSALLASKIISYAQGFMLLRNASKEYNWQLDFGRIAMVWREGCIIRSSFLSDINNAFIQDANLSFLGSSPYFRNLLQKHLPLWRKAVAKAIECGVPMPAMSAALTFLDGYSCANLPANVLQAQRDYFGAHTYERVDGKRGEFFHTDWTGHGGNTASTLYDA